MSLFDAFSMSYNWPKRDRQKSGKIGYHQLVVSQCNILTKTEYSELLSNCDFTPFYGYPALVRAV